MLRLLVFLSILLIYFVQLSFGQPSPSPSGVLLGVVSYPNNTIGIIRINEKTGAVQLLDQKFQQKKTGYLYYGASAADPVKGIYFVSLLSGQSSSLLLAVDARTGRTLAQSTASDKLYFLLGFDSSLGTLFGAALDVSTKIATLYKINPHTFAATAVGNYPKGVPLDNGGSYDSVHGIMYYLYATTGVNTAFAGIDVRTGKITVNVPLSRTEIYFTLYYDDVKERIISIAQNFTGTDDFYLATLNNNGQGATIGPFTFSGKNFYPTVSAIASTTREYYALMTTQNDVDFIVASLDTGEQIRTLNRWDYLPIDLCWIPLSN